MGIFSKNIPFSKVDCLIDRTHDALEGVNIFLNNNINVANGMLIVVGLFLDFLTFSSFLYWLIKQ